MHSLLSTIIWYCLINVLFARSNETSRSAPTSSNRTVCAFGSASGCWMGDQGWHANGTWTHNVSHACRLEPILENCGLLSDTLTENPSLP